MKRMTETSEGVQTVEKALSVLTTFTDASPLWGITELSRELDLPKSVIHRIIISLQKFGFVEKDLHTEKYRLGLKLSELGKVASGSLSLRKNALPIMQELTRVTGESTLLTVRDGHDAICIEFVEGSQTMTLKTSLGIRLPLHCGASKKILLAFQPDTFINQYIQEEALIQISDNSVIEKNALLQELDKIRESGIAITANEIDIGATLIAAPVFGYDSNLIAGLGLGGPLFRFTEEKVHKYIQYIKKAALDLSVLMGYHQ